MLYKRNGIYDVPVVGRTIVELVSTRTQFNAHNRSGCRSLCRNPFAELVFTAGVIWYPRYMTIRSMADLTPILTEFSSRPPKPGTSGDLKKTRGSPVGHKNPNFPLRWITALGVSGDPLSQPTCYPGSSGQTQRCHRHSWQRARRPLTCLQLTDWLRVSRLQVCRQDWSEARSRCCMR